MMNAATYAAVRPALRQGDVIAFGGRGLFSSIIKAVTFSPVSHVGIVMQTKLAIEGSAQPGMIVSVLESTTLYKPKDGPAVRGVSENRLSDRVDEYDGQMWWLPLAERVRAQIDWAKFFDLCWREKGRGYNMPQALLAGLPIPQFFSSDKNRFCSQLVAHALKEAGVADLRKVNPANVNPQELCSMRLYSDDYVQLKGKPREIPLYNRTQPWLANV